MLAALVNAAARRVKAASDRGLLFAGFRTLRALGQRHLIVRMDTSWQCNLRCRTCHFSDPAEETLRPMDPELFARIAKDVFPRALHLALSCGAEPYMTRDFSSYLKVAASYRVPWLVLITNGTLLNEQRVEELIDARVRELVVSIDGATRETYEAIRVNASFDRLVRNLGIVRDVKARRRSRFPLLRFNFVVMRENLHEMAQLVDLVRPFGTDRIQVRHLGVNEGMALDFGASSVRGAEDAFDAQLALLRKRAREARIALDAPQSFAEARRRGPSESRAKPACMAPWMMVYVHPDGSYRPCVYHALDRFPSFRDHSLDEIAPALDGVKELLLHDAARSCLQICQPRRGSSHSVTTQGLVTLDAVGRPSP